MKPHMLVAILVTALAACSSTDRTLPIFAGNPDVGAGNLDLAPSRTYSTGRCRTRIDAICHEDGCEVMGQYYPVTLAGWCSPNQNIDASGTVACIGWSVVSTLADGDQPTDLYYDSNGKIVAITRWQSNPPCLGACLDTCVAGPSDFSPAALVGCSEMNADLPCRDAGSGG